MTDDKSAGDDLPKSMASYWCDQWAQRIYTSPLTLPKATFFNGPMLDFICEAGNVYLYRDERGFFIEGHNEWAGPPITPQGLRALALEMLTIADADIVASTPPSESRR